MIRELARSCRVEAIAPDSRIAVVRFSSERPVERWWGSERTCHDEGACDLSLLNAGAAVLLNHDADRRIGIVESAWITPERTGEAEIRLAKTVLGDEALAEIIDGTLRWISMGYRAWRYSFQTLDNGDELFTCRTWQPFELSMVSLPANADCQILSKPDRD